MATATIRQLKAAITRHTNAQVAKARHRFGYCSEIDDGYYRRVKLARIHLASIIAELEKSK